MFWWGHPEYHVRATLHRAISFLRLKRRPAIYLTNVCLGMCRTSTARLHIFGVQSRNKQHCKDPSGYFEAGGKHMAFGRGLLWEPWEDTAQLNYGEPELRAEMRQRLCKIAGMADGVRCDVAMLVEQELLVSTWGSQLKPERNREDVSEFWPKACQEARAVNPNFIFMAESYWEREKPLMDKGFDFCYDKVLYDRLVAGDGEGVDKLLDLDQSYQDKLVRFLENHDEDRAAAVFTNVDQHMAAAVLTFTVPGLHFLHDGQEAGRHRRVSMHIKSRLPEDADVPNKGLKALYKILLTAISGAALRNGAWERCSVFEFVDGGDGNPTVEAKCGRVMTHFSWSPEQGGGPFTEVVMVVVNYSPDVIKARIRGKEGGRGAKMLRELLKGRDCMLSDRLSSHRIPIDGETFIGTR